VILNFVYFVVSSLAPLVYPRGYYGSVSFNALPISLLILCLAFLSFDMGVLLSGGLPKTRRVIVSGPARIAGLGVLTTLAAVALWSTRIVLATMGYGITHVPTMVTLDPDVSQMSVLSGSLAYVPLCLCLARLCSHDLLPGELRVWRRRLAWVFVADLLYYVLTGSRLGLLWEILIPLWACWCRKVRVLSRVMVLVLGLAVAAAVPLIYAQRSALAGLRPQLGENHLKLTRDYLPAAEGDLAGANLWSTLTAGAVADASRLSAIGPFSGVAEKVVSGRYSLMWGNTLGAELPLLVPHLLWPAKPVGEKIDYIINRHFNLFSFDELTTCQTELLANFGIVGLCVGLLLYGVVTERVCAPLAPGSSASEPTLFFLLCAMPLVFRVETDITMILAGLRLLVPVWALLRAFEQRGSLQLRES